MKRAAGPVHGPIQLTVLMGDAMAAAWPRFRRATELRYREYGVAMCAPASAEPPAGLLAVVAARQGARDVAGIRIHARRAGGVAHWLPLESALPSDPRFSAWRRRVMGPAAMELCGTFVDAEHRGTGLSECVVEAAVTSAWSLGAELLLGIAPEHALPIYRRAGFEAVEGLPAWSFPTPRYRTRIAALAAPRDHTRSALGAGVGRRGQRSDCAGGDPGWGLPVDRLAAPRQRQHEADPAALLQRRVSVPQSPLPQAPFPELSSPVPVRAEALGGSLGERLPTELGSAELGGGSLRPGMRLALEVSRQREAVTGIYNGNL